jgi:hypothetical protein
LLIDSGSLASLLGLLYAAEAPFNSYTKQHEQICLPDTRVDLLREIYEWADRQDERSIFWLNGLAGTGKSTIARTVTRHYFDKKRLGASFFFSRGGGDVSRASKFATSIAMQLATSIPALRQYISDAVMKNTRSAEMTAVHITYHLIMKRHYNPIHLRSINFYSSFYRYECLFYLPTDGHQTA